MEPLVCTKRNKICRQQSDGIAAFAGRLMPVRGGYGRERRIRYSDSEENRRAAPAEPLEYNWFGVVRTLVQSTQREVF